MINDLKELTVGGVEAQWLRLEREIGKPLGLERDPVDVDKAMLEANPDAVRKTGIIQGLRDLGYLEERVERTPFSDIEIEEALKQWRTDTRKLPATYHPKKIEGGKALNSTDLDLTDSLPILVLQTSFDGELTLSRMPSPGEPPSLLSRILQFRLKTFNRYEEPVGLPLTPQSYDTFRKLKASFSRTSNETDLTLFNRLGNGLVLSEIFCRRYRKQVFVALNDPNTGKKPDTGRRAEEFTMGREKRPIGKRRSRGSKRRGRQTSTSNSTVLIRHRRKKRDSTLQKDFSSDINSLGLELLQLRLWQHGYYRGVVDADWGKRSRIAFDDFLKSFKEFDLKRKEIIADVDGGQVINLAYIFEDLFGVAEDTAAEISGENIDEIAEKIFPHPDKEEADDFWEKFRSNAEAIEEEESETLKLRPVKTFRHGKKKPNRRRRRMNLNFLGVKAAITGWFRRARETVTEIAKTVLEVARQLRDAIAAGLESIRAVLRYALTKIKRVIRIAAAAVQRFYYWIAGKPFGSGDPETKTFILSRWSIDFDTVNYCRKDSPRELIEHHLARIAFMNASFHFMASLALTVLGIMTSAATGNWLRLAFKTYAAIKEMEIWASEENPFLGSSFSKTAFAT